MAHVKKDGSYLEPGFVKAVATEYSEESSTGISAYYKAMELACRRKFVLEVAGITLEELQQKMGRDHLPLGYSEYPQQAVQPDINIQLKRN